MVELRARVNTLRARYGFAAFAWTDASLIAGSTVVRAVHLTELRTALDQAYVAAGRTPPTYADPVIAARTTTISVLQIAELRLAIAALEQ